MNFSICTYPQRYECLFIYFINVPHTAMSHPSLATTAVSFICVSRNMDLSVFLIKYYPNLAFIGVAT